MDRGFEIADIIVAFIKGEATPQQIGVLDDWVNESEENKHLFVSLLDETAFEQRRVEQKVSEVEEAFEQVRTKKMQKARKNRLYNISIAASVAIIVVSGILMYWGNIPENSNLTTQQEMITVGRSKAFLTLATGEKVFLDKQDTVLRSQVTNIRVQEKGKVSYEVADSSVAVEVEYNTMETPRGAEFQLVLSDGTKVWLNAESKLRYPVNFIGNERRVQLTGEAYFDVRRDEESPFVVETSRSDITVLGTEFCVRDYVGQANQTTLVNGSVRVRNCRGETHVIKPGQQVNIKGDSMSVTEVETIYFTSWKDGYFIFDQATLSEIMSELSKWYDFDCFFINTSAANIRLTARLKKYDDINVILDILSGTGDIYFLQKGRAITIGNIDK